MTTSVMGRVATCKPQAHRPSHVLDCGLRWHTAFQIGCITHHGGDKRQMVTVGLSPSAIVSLPTCSSSSQRFKLRQSIWFSNLDVESRCAVSDVLVATAARDHAVAVATCVSASSRVSRCPSALAGGKNSSRRIPSATVAPFQARFANITSAFRSAVRFGTATGAIAAARPAAGAATGPAVAASASSLGDAAPTGPEVAVADLAQMFPKGEYSVEMQVRDYELDQFNVVNNAVYSSFFQHGRHEAFAALGHDVDEYGRRGTPLALSQLNITFRAPLRSRDVFRVTVSVQRVSGARVVFYQRILKCLRRLRGAGGEPAAAGGQKDEKEQTVGEELIAEAEAVVVFLDSNYRPARVPKDAARMLQALADLRKE